MSVNWQTKHKITCKKMLRRFCLRIWNSFCCSWIMCCSLTTFSYSSCMSSSSSSYYSSFSC